MHRRLIRIRLITLGSVMGAFAVASLIGGIALFGTDPSIGTAFDILGALLVLATVVCFVGLIISERIAAPTLTAGQKAGVVTYLRVSRFVRGVVEAVVGVALITVGIGYLVGGNSFGVWILLFGILLGLLAVANLWLARRLRYGPRQPDSETPT